MNIPNDLIKDKKILLAVTGSIAIYKTLELVRNFVKAGAEVKVVMSQSAKKFIAPLTFETLTSNQVLDDTNESWANEHNHIQTTEWADIMVIAPATANTIAKLANAIADNMLLQCALAFSGMKILAPSANTNMLENPITQANLKMLGISNYTILETQTKELACKTVGDGAMAEPLDIFYQTCRELLKEEFWEHRRVIVTGGGTIEKIDEVRYISNFSSGKMASALATALYLKGADVNLIATKFDSDLPVNMHKIEVEDSEEMLEYLVDSIRIAKKGKLSKPTLVRDEHIHVIQKKPYLFMAAAVSDYVPEFPQDSKLKKENLGEKWELGLKKNIDILSSIDKEGITVIGFKAEIDKDKAKENAKEMLQKKGLDGVCLNILDNAQSFGSDDNEIEFITAHKDVLLPRDDKLSVSFEIVKNAKELQE
ncbi:bifunctional phosphopantothenoylcysteine decarboxylase/phosphopantothenate--cysteine ligase CoaBC [Sulfurimonas autotrophica]|uniref:Coenzyme A biosynthesis bifunctional protein CoaBC n=1 Tax=Sulfurimonas autotrophica (strain ATCC BAA-671 / DSM 16294 / JCM 11897 / OK10) TaxID=563040 RepID=E0UTG7_SULAO|nr:bifunctional phosphopantothenoylcysteine decarboxylase/phosphopantothenate--cysteine ligase CoaBC [Sulfurimonas autotrophica]ADN09332.1 Phosphopantothenoylcysteine decarboxylase; Phosphopantothenate-cysteine ligase [Sulfurimonas autotrophica DSM 16294]